MRIFIKKLSNSVNLPRYHTAGSAGMDLVADIKEPIVIKPHQRMLVPTGIAISLPVGYEAQIRPRSGLALKNGIMLANDVGTIDSDYRGEIGVILLNTSTTLFRVEPSMRIAQMIVSRYESAEWQEVDDLDETERGSGGYGSTGKNV